MSVSQSPCVLKFGGSSVGRPERLVQVLARIVEEADKGPVDVVVSAFGDTTDHLIAAGTAACARDLVEATRIAREVFAQAASLAEHGGAPASAVARELAELQSELERLLSGVSVVGELSPAVRDEVLSFGERTSARVVAACLEAKGKRAIAIDARDWAVTDSKHGDASVLWEATLPKLRALAERVDSTVVRVHTGFLGRTVEGRTTTLGRNGSDYTAAILARGLGAREVSIWTDVPGVLTGDPSLVDEAYPVPTLSYREALELAGLGLKMLHPRTVLPLLAAGIPMRIRSTMRPDHPGTVVDATGAADRARPTCVTSLEDMALMVLEGTQRSAPHRIGPRAVSALAKEGVAVWFETQASRGNGAALVVDASAVERAREAIAREFAAELHADDVNAPEIVAPVTLVTLVAEAMGRTVNVAGRFFGALGAVGVNVLAAAQGATSRSISCVVAQSETAVAVRAVHAAMNLAREQVNVLLLGKGTVGSHFLSQLASEADKLREAHDVEVRLTGVADSRRVAFDDRGLSPREALARLESASGADVTACLDALAKLPVPVLVDCSAADGMEALYEAALQRGIHVVAANKKPLALPLAARQRIFEAARAAHRAYRYETTVGASLPVIDTLKNLVRTGDVVRLIEGSLSGTLGYLCNELNRGVRLSVAVHDAQDRGYTEPHPRDDLAGTDAGRKALILARELGLDVELSDVVIEPFVDRRSLAHDDLDAFYGALRAEDDAFEAKMKNLRASGRILRYLAQIDPGDPANGQKPSIRVGAVGVPADHPATRLRGTEAFVAFTTDRYREYPLVVQGAGAGGAVTAAGVLADVLALSQSLRGR